MIDIFIKMRVSRVLQILLPFSQPVLRTLFHGEKINIKQVSQSTEKSTLPMQLRFTLTPNTEEECDLGDLSADFIATTNSADVLRYYQHLGFTSITNVDMKRNQ